MVQRVKARPRRGSTAICGALAVLSGVLAAPTTANALKLQCAPRAAIFENLERRHGEVPAHTGVTHTGSLFEVLVSPDGTWTAFFSFPDGLTCPVATGEGWRQIHPTAPPGERSSLEEIWPTDPRG